MSTAMTVRMTAMTMTMTTSTLVITRSGRVSPARPRLAERKRAARPPRPAEVDDAQARRRAVRRERAAVRHGDRPGRRSVVARAEELDGTRRRARFLEGGVARHGHGAQFLACGRGLSGSHG